MSQFLQTSVHTTIPGEARIMFSQRFGLPDGSPLVRHYLDYRVSTSGLQMLIEELQLTLDDLASGTPHERREIEIPFTDGLVDDLVPV